MKLNLPVTQKEVALKKGSSIVSKTDLKGAITYINRDFLEISGFTEEELIGKNHNVIRHPDMPPEAFADLWATVKANKPWNGMVKNRCKNGDHYWVEANVSPVVEHGTVVGYMSVRSEPTRKQVEAAEKLYKQMRDGIAPKESVFAKFAKKIADTSIILKAIPLIATPVLASALLSYLLGLQNLAGLAISTGVGIAASLISVYFFHQWFSKSILTAKAELDTIANGDFTSSFYNRADDELGKLMQSLKKLQIRVGFEFNDAKKLLEESDKLKTALDNSTSAFTFSDAQGKL